MPQQIFALLIIALILARLFWQKQKKLISANEMLFWLIFWLLAALAIIYIKNLDRLVAKLGFSGSGIEVLLYLSVAIIFYLIFRLRLKLEKIERNLTEIIKFISLNIKK